MKLGVRVRAAMVALSIASSAALVRADTAQSGPEPYRVGSRIEPFSLEDQFKVERALDEQVRFVLFSRDMDGGDILREAVEGETTESLQAIGAVYVADIHRMPSLVASLMAIPRMRSRGYPMWLDREGTATARLPDREGHATVLELAGLELRAVHHLDAPEAVRERLGLPPAAANPD